MEKFDAIVIGGGLLGCFAARNLVRYNLKVALLEKREDLCTGISRANTAIVYSGCDTKPGSLKTKLCVKGSQDFQKICNELGVRYNKCGSLMISFGKRADESIHKKFEQGMENGVRDMKILSAEEVKRLEPNIADSVRGGLYAPDTGTVMPWELCLAAAENAIDNGAQIRLSTEVTDIKKNTENSDEYIVKTNRGTYATKSIINCAGMDSDNILALAENPTVKIIPTAGDYIVLDTEAAGHISHIIFHEPEEKGKGLTLVPTVDGNILIGPTERDLAEKNFLRSSREANIENRDFENDFFSTTTQGLNLLKKLVSEIIPALPLEKTITSFGAVRPNPLVQEQDENGNWKTDGRSLGDLSIIESENGTSINLVGIKTPGMTCANELGDYIAKKIATKLAAKKNIKFNPFRKPPIRISELETETRQNLISKRPDYGHIICRCRGISEGEIIDAINRNPGATTLDGIKQRTGAQSGRCQGGYCTCSILKILAKELDCDVENITKSGGNSWVVKRKT